MNGGCDVRTASEFGTKVFKIFHNYKNVCIFYFDAPFGKLP